MRYDSAIFMKSAYIQGHSFLHRLKIPYKLAALFFLVFCLYMGFYPVFILAAAYGFFIFLVIYNRLPWRLIGAYIKPFLFFLIYISVIFAFFQNGQKAVFYGLRLLVLMGFSILFLLTTPITKMQDFLLKIFQLFKYVGVNPQYPTMAIILTLRALPQMGGIIESLTEARKARGLKARRYLVILPAVVQALLLAKHMSEALEVRGWPIEENPKV